MRLPHLRGQNALREALKILPAIGGLHIDIFNFGGTQIEEANYIPAFVSLHGILAFADGLIKYNDNDPDGSLPEPLQTLYSNINAADDEAAKVAAIDSAKNAGTITENLANRQYLQSQSLLRIDALYEIVGQCFDSR